ncbi:hypothetical protein IWX46DRAFT_584119 [Phyllosticta citricarpa]|uniref:Uncharacterized protein n=1 Tax=Phyllosticta citricarpa TaxID=55181 RepID=A0ABR1LL59_9PEZI
MATGAWKGWRWRAGQRAAGLQRAQAEACPCEIGRVSDLNSVECRERERERGTGQGGSMILSDPRRTNPGAMQLWTAFRPLVTRVGGPRERSSASDPEERAQQTGARSTRPAGSRLHIPTSSSLVRPRHALGRTEQRHKLLIAADDVEGRHHAVTRSTGSVAEWGLPEAGGEHNQVESNRSIDASGFVPKGCAAPPAPTVC